MAKHGVAGLTRTAAAEGARHGIRVNCVCPGPIDTPLMAESERLVNPDDPGFERRRFEGARRSAATAGPRRSVRRSPGSSPTASRT